MEILQISLSFLILLIFTIVYTLSEKYKSSTILLLFSFLQGFLLSFIYANFFNMHLLSSIIYLPLFSGIYYLLFKQLPHIIIVLKIKKQEYYDESLSNWIESIEVLKNKEISMKKYSGKHSLNSFITKIPLSKKIWINIGKKLIDKFSEKEKIVVIAHEIGHQLKHHFLLGIVTFSVLVILITFLFAYVRNYTLLNFLFTFEIRLTLFFIFAFMFYLLVIIIGNGISFINEYNADKQAVILTGDYTSFKSMMFKFKKEKPTKNYGSIIDLVIYDHPSVDNRIKKVKRYQK